MVVERLSGEGRGRGTGVRILASPGGVEVKASAAFGAAAVALAAREHPRCRDDERLWWGPLIKEGKWGAVDGLGLAEY